MKPFAVGGAGGGSLECSKLITENINRLFANREPWQVATITATAVLSSVWLWSFINQDESKLLCGFFGVFRFNRDSQV